MLSSRVELQKATQTMDTNPIKTAITVCSELIRKKVGQSTGSYTSNFSKLYEIDFFEDYLHLGTCMDMNVLCLHFFECIFRCMP